MTRTQFQGHSIKANISQMVHPIHSTFGSRLGFSGSADRMALFSVRPNSNKGGVGENMVFSGFMHEYLENGTRIATTKVIIND